MHCRVDGADFATRMNDRVRQVITGEFVAKKLVVAEEGGFPLHVDTPSEELGSQSRLAGTCCACDYEAVIELRIVELGILFFGCLDNFRLALSDACSDGGELIKGRS